MFVVLRKKGVREGKVKIQNFYSTDGLEIEYSGRVWVMFKNLKNLNHHFIRPTGATESYREFIKFTANFRISWNFPSEERVMIQNKETSEGPTAAPYVSPFLTNRQEIQLLLLTPTRPPHLIPSLHSTRPRRHHPPHLSLTRLCYLHLTY